MFILLSDPQMIGLHISLTYYYLIYDVHSTHSGTCGEGIHYSVLKIYSM